MVSTDRWQRAQRYERDYWSSIASSISAGAVSQMDWYRWRAQELVRRLQGLGLGNVTAGQARVLEIGCGPVGVAGFFPASERVAIDPLETYYGSNPTLSALRNPSVDYRQGMAEALPVENGRFDLAIIENCIDHCRDVTGAMNEISRALRPNGVLYLTVNCRTRWGFVAHRTLSNLRIDAGHPYTFTPRRVRRLFQRHGWNPRQFEVGSYTTALREDLTGPGIRSRLKGLLGISEFVVSVVGQRQTGAPAVR